MITADETEYIEEHAYLPEHVPSYGTAVLQSEPFLFDDYVAHARADTLVFVGYPLTGPLGGSRMGKALGRARGRLHPHTVVVIAPDIPSSVCGQAVAPSDHYYRLDLSALSVSQKVRNMVHRASRHLSVETAGAFTGEHKRLVGAFLETHAVGEGTRIIFGRIGDYVHASETAKILEARDKAGELVAFDVIEFGTKRYALYMFNFRAEKRPVPGASDLLLSNVVRCSVGEGKAYLNLGLGINSGVAFFKEKWGGTPFLPYSHCLYRPEEKETLSRLFEKL